MGKMGKWGNLGVDPPYIEKKKKKKKKKNNYRNLGAEYPKIPISPFFNFFYPIY